MKALHPFVQSIRIGLVVRSFVIFIFIFIVAIRFRGRRERHVVVPIDCAKFHQHIKSFIPADLSISSGCPFESNFIQPGSLLQHKSLLLLRIHPPLLVNPHPQSSHRLGRPPPVLVVIFYNLLKALLPRHLFLWLSHTPKETNGFKFLNAFSGKRAGEEGFALWRRFLVFQVLFCKFASPFTHVTDPIVKLHIHLHVTPTHTTIPKLFLVRHQPIKHDIPTVKLLLAFLFDGRRVHHLFPANAADRLSVLRSPCLYQFIQRRPKRLLQEGCVVF
mmetsp:Transcript_41547/g.71134  ORF Transcript_41547/g.71134 Transcript_41547/m.71134 type:complete len:274 (-) Transcript_41547:277-1098(-)